MEAELEKLISCARAVVNNWDEFGPEGGMDELIHHLRDALGVTPKLVEDLEELRVRDRLAYGPRHPGIEIVEMIDPGASYNYSVGASGGSGTLGKKERKP